MHANQSYNGNTFPAPFPKTFRVHLRSSFASSTDPYSVRAPKSDILLLTKWQSVCFGHSSGVVLEDINFNCSEIFVARGAGLGFDVPLVFGCRRLSGAINRYQFSLPNPNE